MVGEKLKGLVDPDYLSFLLDELVFERKWHRDGGCVGLLEKMIHEELDRWGLGEQQELELAGILAERHGARVTEPGAS